MSKTREYCYFQMKVGTHGEEKSEMWKEHENEKHNYQIRSFKESVEQNTAKLQIRI